MTFVRAKLPTVPVPACAPRCFTKKFVPPRRMAAFVGAPVKTVPLPRGLPNIPPSNTTSVKVEQTLREVQISRSRLRFILLWMEQMSPAVADSAAADRAEDDERNPPSLTLANSVLSILREPLPSDGPSSGLRVPNASPRSRVSVGDTCNVSFRVQMIDNSFPALPLRDLDRRSR